MIPTGGVTTETVAAFFQAGAFAVGVGSALVEAGALASGDLKRIEANARKFVTAVEQARAGLQR
jgi:2-dehydro-3-deoxyphosphogluconate aldolase / (4S)-4-hydroxy-2-oxoglutarate aldolase